MTNMLDKDKKEKSSSNCSIVQEASCCARVRAAKLTFFIQKFFNEIVTRFALMPDLYWCSSVAPQWW